MEREDARAYVQENAQGYFKPDKKGTGYICPICGSGGGPKGTGITTKDGKHFTCWRGCFKNADIFDIIGLQYNIGDYNGILERACDIFGIQLDKPASYPQGHTKTAQPCEVRTTPEEITGFLKEAARHIEGTTYHRGISLETLKRFGVGYVPSWGVTETAPKSPRLIIPHSDGKGYLARDTREHLTEKQDKYAKIQQRAKTQQGYNIPMTLFNGEALKQTEVPVFVVEGELDALSIIDAGGCAVALSSLSNKGKLIDAVKAQKPEQPLILLLDSDKSGEKETEYLKENLKALNIFSLQATLPEKKEGERYKDANEYYMSAPAKFREWIEQTIADARRDYEEQARVDKEDITREAVRYSLNDFIHTVTTNREGQAIPTGFYGLDNLLDGGLYPGLYVVGAISSLGKTTFCLQIADFIAKSGRDVLIFSLEMSRNELIAKSISRLTLLYGTIDKAYTTRGILKGKYTAEGRELINACIEEYNGDCGERLYITEGVGDIGIKEITAKINRVMNVRKQPPVVIIDYGQILAPYREENDRSYTRSTDKQNTDKNITELKRLSRDKQIPVICISSFNRENYSEPVSMASFKESGAIEYSSDVLIGLQYQGMDYKDGEDAPKRKERIRGILKEASTAAANGLPVKIECKILKHRNGRKGSVAFDFFARFNYFRETENR